MNKKIEIITKDGQHFSSLRKACKSLGVDRTTVFRRVKAGVKLTDALDPMFSNENVSPISIAGKSFSRKIDAAIHFGIPYQKFLDRLALGWEPEEAAELKKSKRTLDIEDKASRMADFAKSNNITLHGARTRLTLRRKRFRAWLELPHIDNAAHANATHLRDKQNRWFYSIAQAADYHKVTVSQVLKITNKVSEDLIYGDRLPIDNELEISFGSILLLLTHPNVLQRELGKRPLKRLRLDSNVITDISIKNTLDGVESTMLVEDEAIISVTVKDDKVTGISSNFINMSKIALFSQAQWLFAAGCSRNTPNKLPGIFKDGTKELNLHLPTAS